MEYLSNHWADLRQILFNLKKLNVVYLNNHVLKYILYFQSKQSWFWYWPIVQGKLIPACYPVCLFFWNLTDISEFFILRYFCMQNLFSSVEMLLLLCFLLSTVFSAPHTSAARNHLQVEGYGSKTLQNELEKDIPKVKFISKCFLTWWE